MRKLRIAAPLGFQTASKEDISAFIRAGLQTHKDLGFDAADFSTPLLDLAGTGWKAQAEQALADSKTIGMPLAVAHLPYVKGGCSHMPAQFHEDFAHKMRNAIEAAALLGVECAVLHTSTGTMPLRDFDWHKELEWVKGHIAPFAEHAAKHGLKLVVENMPVIPGNPVTRRFSQTSEDICAVADYFGLGICWDFGHANVSGGHQSEHLAYIGDRLKMVHVHDNCGMADQHNPPFTGTVDWQDAMAGLEKIGFRGVFDMELSPAKIPAPVRMAYGRLAVEAADQLMEYMK